MKIALPIVKPLDSIVKVIKVIGKGVLSKPQLTSLSWIMSYILLGYGFNLRDLERTSLSNKSRNASSWFFSHATFDIKALTKNIFLYAIKECGLRNVTVQIIIDDTLKHHSRWCKVINSVFYLYDHVINKTVSAKCIVFAYCVCNDTIRFPVGWRFYKKDSQTKNELALELVDEALELGLKIDYVIADSWYAVAPFLEGLHRRKLRYICELKSNNTLNISVKDKGNLCLENRDFFQAFSKFCHKQTVGLKKSKQEAKASYECLYMIGFINALDHKVFLVHSSCLRTGKVKVLVSNDLKLDPKKTVALYYFRWLIEEFFRNAKQLFHFEDARLRSERAGSLEVLCLSLADILLCLENMLAEGHCQQRPKTAEAIISQIQEESILNFIAVITDPEQSLSICQKWLLILNKLKERFRRLKKEVTEIIQPPEEIKHCNV